MNYKFLQHLQAVTSKYLRHIFLLYLITWRWWTPDEAERGLVICRIATSSREEGCTFDRNSRSSRVVTACVYSKRHHPLDLDCWLVDFERRERSWVITCYVNKKTNLFSSINKLKSRLSSWLKLFQFKIESNSITNLLCSMTSRCWAVWLISVFAILNKARLSNEIRLLFKSLKRK